MPDDGHARAPQRTGIAAVGDAEIAAEKLVREARAEAERIIADAKERARTIREGSHGAGEASVQAERDTQAEQAEEERRGILEAARMKIEEMRQPAQAREREVAEKLVALLFGES